MTTETTPAWPRAALVGRRLLTWYVVGAGRVVTVDELVSWLHDAGFEVPGRASKTVADTDQGSTRLPCPAATDSWDSWFAPPCCDNLRSGHVDMRRLSHPGGANCRSETAVRPTAARLRA